MKKVTVYECEYCKRKRYKSFGIMFKHEKSCMKNPDAINCYKCKNLKRNNENRAYCEYKDKFTIYTALTCKHYNKGE